MYINKVHRRSTLRLFNMAKGKGPLVDDFARYKLVVFHSHVRLPNGIIFISKLAMQGSWMFVVDIDI